MTGNDDQVRIAIGQQAAEWFVANRDGDMTQKRRTEFMHWLRASPLHVEEYLLLGTAVRDLRSAAADPQQSLDALLADAALDDARRVMPLAGVAEVAGPQRLLPPLSWLRRSRFAPLLAPVMAPAMASLAAIALVAVLLLGVNDWQLPGGGQRYQTAHGEQRTWTLPDGSTVQLNSDSALRVRYSRAERLIELTRGQAYFQVAKDAQHRFRVTVDGANVIAVGTQFDIYRRGGNSTVTVIEGQVALYGRGTAPPPAGTPASAAAVRLRAGQQLRLAAAGPLALPVAVDVAQLEAWRQGQIAFDQQPLGEVAAEFSRYALVPIEIVDPLLAAVPISGTFNARDLDSFLDFLQTMDGVTVSRTATRTIVSRRRPAG